MHSTRDRVGVGNGIRATTRSALVRAIRLRYRGCSREAIRREEGRAFARARADLAHGGVGLEDVVLAIRDAWEQVHGQTAPLAGRKLSYYKLVSRCLASCELPAYAGPEGKSLPARGVALLSERERTS